MKNVLEKTNWYLINQLIIRCKELGYIDWDENPYETKCRGAELLRFLLDESDETDSCSSGFLTAYRIKVEEDGEVVHGVKFELIGHQTLHKL